MSTAELNYGKEYRKIIGESDEKNMWIKEINIFDEIEIEKINNLNRKVGSIFSSVSWLRMFGNRIHIFGIYNGNKELVGSFYLFEERKFGLKILRNPYFTPHSGIFIKYPIGIKPVNKRTYAKEILRSVAKFIDALNYSIVSFSLQRKIIDMQPFIWEKFKVVPGYTYVIDLGRDEKFIWNSFSADRRNDVTKALKDGVTVQRNKNNKIIEDLVKKTFDRQGMPTNDYYLDQILNKFANDTNSFSFISMKDNVPIAGSFCVYDKDVAYYLLGGYDSDNRHHGAGALSLWECIKYANKIGLKEFDFEGSMVPQIEKYFRKFGGTLVPYYRVNKASMPLEILLKFFKREVF